MKDMEGSKAAYLKAIDLNSKTGPYFLRLGKLLEEMGDCEGSKAAYLRASQLK